MTMLQYCFRHLREQMEGEIGEVKYFHIEILDGIIQTTFVENLELDFAIAKSYVEAKKAINGTTVMPFLMDARNLKSIDKDARDLISAKDNNIYISAGAILVKNEVQRLIGMIFVFYYSISFPYKIFEEKDKALNWLKHFKNLN